MHGATPPSPEVAPDPSAAGLSRPGAGRMAPSAAEHPGPGTEFGLEQRTAGGNQPPLGSSMQSAI